MNGHNDIEIRHRICQCADPPMKLPAAKYTRGPGAWSQERASNRPMEIGNRFLGHRAWIETPQNSRLEFRTSRSVQISSPYLSVHILLTSQQPFVKAIKLAHILAQPVNPSGVGRVTVNPELGKLGIQLKSRVSSTLAEKLHEAIGGAWQSV
jgi:hypothetical protein